MAHIIIYFLIITLTRDRNDKNNKGKDLLKCERINPAKMRVQKGHVWETLSPQL